jgi:hypothetical protein
MHSKNLALVIGALVLGSGIAHAAPGTPLANKSPDEQYKMLDGHGIVFAAAAMDELGDRVSQYGLYGYLQECLGYGREETPTTLTLRWALCGDDLKRFDISKLRDRYSSDYYYQQEVDLVERWKTLGTRIEEEAKSDKGIAQVLKLRDQAQEEWKSYLAKNQAAFDLYVKLHEAAASGKTNEPAFAGCWEATQPAFAKAVKTTKFAWQSEASESEKLRGRMEEVLTSTENYIAAASFSICAYSVDPSGESLADAVLSARGGQVRVGWRTLLVAKALAPTVKPKFADRALEWSRMLDGMTDHLYLGGIAIGSVADRTPTYGEIKKVIKNGDETTIQFKGDKVETCLKWVETNKVTGYATNGDPMRELI